MNVSVGDHTADPHHPIPILALSFAGVTVSLMLITLCTFYFWDRSLHLQEKSASGTSQSCS